MNEREIIRNNIHQFFENNDNKNVVILPLRNLSGLVSEILNEDFSICEKFLIDSHDYDMKRVFPPDRMPEGYQDCIFFIVAYGSAKTELVKSLSAYVSEDQIVDLLVNPEKEQVYASTQKVHFDFLCPGFAKCGTTSLHYALQKSPLIFLPEVKETNFLRGTVNKDLHDVFKQNYPENEMQGKFVGGIEPAYKAMADDVYQYFGPDLKLIFCVRNPANALYSYFKMAMRCAVTMWGEKLVEAELLEEFGVVCPEMFDKWAQSHLNVNQYADYIKQYLKYYPAEQMKIVVSEELYKSPLEQMDDLQKFIGIPVESRVKYTELPHENKGDKVVRDLSSLRLNKRFWQLCNMLVREENPRVKAPMLEFRKILYEETLVEYNQPMNRDTYEKLMNYYSKSVHELEEIMGRSLQGIWY